MNDRQIRKPTPKINFVKGGSPSPIIYFCLLMSICFLNNPYKGLFHDANLYAVQAFFHIHPDIFKHDLFFQFGSQDSFTIFPLIYSALINTFGLPCTSILLMILGNFLWVYAAYFFFRILTNGIICLICLACILTINAYYGGFDLFSYKEGFLTPRIFSEALVLLSFGTLLKNRVDLTLLFMIVAFLLHPLMTIGPLAVVMTYLFTKNHRWGWCFATGFLILLILFFFQVEPFVRLIQTMDKEWLTVVTKRNAYIFPTLWPMENWESWIVDVFVVATGITLLSNNEKILLSIILIISIVSLIVSIVAGDLLSSVLVIQLQLWRTNWLLTLFANFLFAYIPYRLWTSPNKAIFCHLIIAAYFSKTIGIVAVSVFLSVLIFILVAAEQKKQPQKLFMPIYYITLFLSGFLFLYSIWIKTFHTFIIWELLWKPDVVQLCLKILRSEPFDLSMGLFLVWLLFRINHYNKLMAFFVSAILLAVSLQLWDGRENWIKYIEKKQDPAPFHEIIKDDSQTYWENGFNNLWFLMDRASYFSRQQGVGGLFNRATALEFIKRFHDLQEVLGYVDYDISYPQKRNSHPQSPLTKASIYNVCNRASALDFLVLSRGIPGLYLETWHSPIPDQEIIYLDDVPVIKNNQDFYLYDCQQLRAQSDSNFIKKNQSGR